MNKEQYQEILMSHMITLNIPDDHLIMIGSDGQETLKWNTEKEFNLLIAGTSDDDRAALIEQTAVQLMMNNIPAKLRIRMIDVYGNLNSELNRSSHLTEDVITGVKEGYDALESTFREINRRWNILADHGCKNIDELNEKNQRYVLPELFVYIDGWEMFHLIKPSISKETKQMIYKGETVGVHFVIAGREPFRKPFDMHLVNRFPLKVIFRVDEISDSRRLSDESGAEELTAGEFIRRDRISRIQGTIHAMDDDFVRRLMNVFSSIWSERFPMSPNMKGDL